MKKNKKFTDEASRSYQVDECSKSVCESVRQADRQTDRSVSTILLLLLLFLRLLPNWLWPMWALSLFTWLSAALSPPRLETTDEQRPRAQISVFNGAADPTGDAAFILLKCFIPASWRLFAPLCVRAKKSAEWEFEVGLVLRLTVIIYTDKWHFIISKLVTTIIRRFMALMHILEFESARCFAFDSNSGKSQQHLLYNYLLLNEKVFFFFYDLILRAAQTSTPRQLSDLASHTPQDLWAIRRGDF